MDAQLLLVIVCILASLAATGAVSPWTPVTAPLLSMVLSCTVALIFGSVQWSANKSSSKA